MNQRIILFGAVALALGACTIKESGSDDQAPAREAFVPTPPPAPFVPEQPAPQPRRFVILHTNDEHSHLLGFSPVAEYPYHPDSFDGATAETDVAAVAARIAADDQTVGGLVRRAYLIEKLKAESTDPVLTLSAGDVMMGTMFHLAMDQAAPDWVSLSLLGYDFVTLGNHEFDWGPDKLADSIEAAQRVTFGAATPIIASNIHFDDVVDGDSGSKLQGQYGDGNSGAPVMPWATKTLPNGLKVGFLGLLGYDAALVAPAKAPITFSVPDTGAVCPATACDAGESCVRGHCVDPLDAQGHVAAMAVEAQGVVDTLRNQEHVDVVVAMTHLGTVEDQALATLTHGIDVIIGGHSHTELAPTVVSSLVSGQTVIVQAGSYGRKLGQLTLSVSPTGAVTFVPAESLLHDVDHTLDAEIIAGSDLANGVVSEAFHNALALTEGLITPVMAGINAQLAPVFASFGLADILDTVVTSDHDIIGEVEFHDTPLSQMITDAERGVVAAGICYLEADPLIGVQANGVIRESLRFGGADDGVSFDDVFRVLPLGASPFEGAFAGPGYPVVMFKLDIGGLYAGMDIGVTFGLTSDQFFLAYSGARVSYDTTRAPFDPTDPDNTGRVTKIELDLDGNGTYDQTVFDIDEGTTFLARWANPAQLFTIVTNLYLAGFLDAFGLHPLNAARDEVSLAETIVCQTLAPSPACPADPALGMCNELAPSAGPVWTKPELKEWQALITFLRSPPISGAIPSAAYTDAAPERVVDVTP